jgi:class 3 adenylate cyclase/streptogramin lyase
MRDDFDVSSVTSATATFVFTDIEGSTELLKTHRVAYSSILAEHHHILREGFTKYGGREVDNQGDSFFVAFARAKDAVLAAADIQQVLATHAWPDGATVRVRIGIHTGEAELTVDRYVGLSVHRAARISAIGHGGQVLVSATTAGLLEDEGDLPGVRLRDLGEHRLKDIERPVRIFQLDIDGLGSSFPVLKTAPRVPTRRRRRIVLGAAALLVLGGIALALASASHDEPPPEVVPNSLVRIDPDTLDATDVFPIGGGADRLISSGGYLWVMHHVLRDTDSAEIRNAGDHTISRVDPRTGEVVVVGGGLAPCGLTADPSGDVWVANCFSSRASRSANVVRIDAASLEFEATWPVPNGNGFIRGLAYGGGSLWLGPSLTGAEVERVSHVTQLDPQTGDRHSFAFAQWPAELAWSEGYGDLWVTHFFDDSLSRLHAATGKVKTVDGVARNPGSTVVSRDTVWTGDWSAMQVARIPAVGSSKPRHVALPIENRRNPRWSVVWQVDAGAGAVWAATPRYGALWRIEPETNAVTEIPIPYLPSGVAADDDAIWVTVRAI